MSEFEWLKETNELIVDSSHALFEYNGVEENGIVIMTKCGDIALTLSELRRIIKDIEEP